MFLLTETSRRLLVSQNRHEVYLNIAEYDKGYLDYLRNEHAEADAKGKAKVDAKDKAEINADSFMKIHSFGPWDMYTASHVNNLAHILLAYTIKVSLDS